MKTFRLFFLLFITFVSILFAASGYAQTQQSQLDRLITSSDTIQKIEALFGLAEYNQDRLPQKSAEYSLRALKMSESIGHAEFTARSHFLAGMAYYYQNKFTSALYHLNSAYDISRSLQDEYGMAAALNRIGNTLHLQGKYTEAFEKYEQALTLNSKINDNQELARSLTNLGSSYRIFGNYEKALQLHLEALEMHEKTGSSNGKAWTALNIARLFKFMKNYKKALEYVDKAMLWYQEVESETGVTTGITLCLKEKAAIFNLRGDIDQAINYSQQVLSINQRNNNQYGVANTYHTLGKIYYQQEEYDTALNYFERSLEIKEMLNDILYLPVIYRYLGDISFQKANTLQAEAYFKLSLKHAKEQNLKQDIEEAYRELARLYEQRGNKAKAYDYFVQYSQLKDSLNNQQINELELQYDFAKRQKQLEFQRQQEEIRQEARLQRQRYYTIGALVALALAMALAYVIYGGYKRKKELNELLSQQNEEIEAQRDEIEAQRDMATQQRDEIGRQKEIITDSIEYARRIQHAILPQESSLKQILNEHFIFYRPKNIVSGDFYWVSNLNGKIFIVASDSTGHGVPGAFMSMLGTAFLNEIIKKNGTHEADEILNQLRANVIESLHQKKGYRGSKEGMDLALCIIDKANDKLSYAGAYNPAWIVRKGELFELKADRMPIGIHAAKNDQSFSQQEFHLEQDDMLYLFSDGYSDQFGGNQGFKFHKKNFKSMLVSIADKPADEQMKFVETTFEEWKGDRPQLDDVLVMGVRYRK
ncbi:MAG: tetratricopeptide repeat protein [Bacteroidota bacterium]